MDLVGTVAVLYVDAGLAGQVLHDLGPAVLVSGAELNLDPTAVTTGVDMDGPVSRILRSCHIVSDLVGSAVASETVGTESLQNPPDLLLGVENGPTTAYILHA